MRCGHEQAEDITEEVYERACRSLKNGAGPNIAPRKWLEKIAKNVCLDHIEKKRKENYLSLEFPTIVDGKEEFLSDHIADEGLSTEEIVERHEHLVALRKAIQALPPRIQQVVIMYYLSGLTSKAISERLKLSTSTIGREKQEGLQQLQERLIEE
jgi:RNA polymerase sigma factor (sigma-70 family)